MSFRVTFKELHTYGSGSSRRLPVRKVDECSRTHIHGYLEITVSGRVLPYLGYFGADDVCIGMWVAELFKAAQVLTHSDPSEFIFDEGEQGQPAFLFRRHGAEVFISIIESPLSGADGDPEWQGVPCSLDEFTSGVAQFLGTFRGALEQELKPAVLNEWWKRHTDGSSV